MPKTNRFRRGLAPLAVLALAVLLLGTAWLHLGWRAIDVTLEDQAGDPAALRGFTLNGRINWNYDHRSLHFSLHDGYLDTELVFDDEDAPFLDRPMVSTDQTYVVATSERANAERNAAEVPQFTNSTVTVQTVVNRVDRMYTLRVRFPGKDTRFVRFSAGAVDLEQPLVAESWVTDTPYELDYRYDYAINDPGAAVRESWSDNVVDARPFLLGDTPVVCWERDYLGRAPGLYRMNGLTEAEIADLPRDGTRYGEEILCGTTEIGSLEPFYCPEGAVEALTGAAMADGSSLLLYLDADNTLWADLVDENGSCTDHQQVTELPAGDVYSAEVYVRTTNRDAVVSLSCRTMNPLGAETPLGSKLAAFRVQDGKFTLVHCQEQTPGNTAAAAVLNAEGNALLLGWYHDAPLPASETGNQPEDGILLEVHPLTGGTSYRGLLRSGIDRDWGNLYDAYSQQRKDRYLTFDPLEGGAAT